MMHLKRWMTGIVAVPVLIYVVGFGPRWLFHGVVFLAALTGLIEFYRITSPECPKFIRWSSLFLCFCLFFFTSRGELFLIPAIVCLWAVLPLTFFMLTYGASRARTSELTGKLVLAPVYICLPLSMLVIMDRFPRGNHWIFFLLSVIFLSDTGAFYFGRFFGRHKLYPEVSPGKTWEGAIGGLLCSLPAVFLFPLFSPIYRPNLSIVVLAACLSISGQIGDLAESMLKRQHGVKDSGRILPGHGGVLDRIDGLLFSIPVLYVFLTRAVV
jgi:phosphatidate cytidylyltransferase